MEIDVKISMYDDANSRDPDANSKTLNRYHGVLWHKLLPNNEMVFTDHLYKSGYKILLHTKNTEILTSSDSIFHTFKYMKQMKNIINEISEKEIEEFFNIASTIGGYVIFPSQKINNKQTINVRRGFHPAIKDRFDLTLECIRRWYDHEKSPLNDVFDRYSSFFSLFVDFIGYVDFFLLNDLVDEDYHIKFWLPFKDFYITDPLPGNVESYQKYMKNAILFVQARNTRILEYYIK